MPPIAAELFLRTAREEQGRQERERGELNPERGWASVPASLVDQLPYLRLARTLAPAGCALHNFPLRERAAYGIRSAGHASAD